MIKTVKYDEELSLSTRAAWLHYGGGLSQTDVAKRLGVTKIKAHRLINRANQDGIVKVSFDGKIAECAALEMQLSNLHRLSYCEVVPDLDEVGLPLRALGIAGAHFLSREIEGGANDVIGVGNGRTLASCVREMRRIKRRRHQVCLFIGWFDPKFCRQPPRRDA
tara:strand:+ start:846 stop:1337 length:492 start_codon:yes stop_codon:yes gene_type:complete